MAATLAGNWFLEGTTDITQWSKQLVFARHEIYGDRITIADASLLVDGDGSLNSDRTSFIAIHDYSKFKIHPLKIHPSSLTKMLPR